VFDVGANVGTYTQALLRLAPGVEIHAFEPHPSTFTRLAERMAGQKVTLRHQAISDHEAMLELYDFALADGSTQASLSREAVAIFDGDIVAHPVRATTIDAYMAETGIAHLALLKIDTEGLDLKVLQGAQRAIRERRIARIQFEFVPANIATHTTMRDMFEALPGYRLQNSVQIFPDSRGKQRPKVSTRGYAIIRPLGWRIWGVGHGYDCQSSISPFGGQGEHQFDRTGAEPLPAHGSQALPDPDRADLPSSSAAHPDARRFPG